MTIPGMPGRAAQLLETIARTSRLLRRHARYGRASWLDRPSAAKAASLQDLFRTVNAFLAQTGATYALAYGTLLGWYRERGLLAHDRDIDFAAPAEDYPRIFAAAGQLPAGYTLHDRTHRHHGPKLYVEHDGWEADIYFFAPEGDRLRSTERSVNPGETTPFPRDYLLPVHPAEFLGVPTFVPAQPELLLRHHYGYLGTDAVRDPVTRYFRPRAG